MNAQSFCPTLLSCDVVSDVLGVPDIHRGDGASVLGWLTGKRVGDLGDGVDKGVGHRPRISGARFSDGVVGTGAGGGEDVADGLAGRGGYRVEGAAKDVEGAVHIVAGVRRCRRLGSGVGGVDEGLSQCIKSLPGFLGRSVGGPLATAMMTPAASSVMRGTISVVVTVAVAKLMALLTVYKGAVGFPSETGSSSSGSDSSKAGSVYSIVKSLSSVRVG